MGQKMIDFHHGLKPSFPYVKKLVLILTN